MRFDQGETVGSAKSKIQRREQLTTWVGAAYAGYIAILSSKVGDRLPDLASAALVTFIIVGVGLLATARSGFEYYVTRIARHIDNKTMTSEAALAAPFDEWPKGAERAYMLTLIMVVLIGVLLISSSWFAAVECTWPKRALIRVWARCAP